MKKKRTLFGAIIPLLVIPIIAAGCGSSETNVGQSGESVPPAAHNQSGTGEKPVTENEYPEMDMRYMLRGTDKARSLLDLMEKKVKERWNVNLEIEMVDKNIYEEKLNVAFAAGNQADIVEIGNQSLVAEAIQNGALIPVDDIIQREPWNQMPESFFKTSSVDGKVYGLPQFRSLPETIYYRVDWAEKLNLKLPTTPDELYEFLYAMAKSDPDGDGVDNTYGFTIRPDFNETSAYFQMFLPVHVTNMGLYLDEEEGVIKSSYYLIDDMKAALAWFRRAHAEGVLDPEWILEVQSNSEDKFMTGKTGAWMKGVQWIGPRAAKIKQGNPDAEITSLPIVNGTYGANYATINSSTANVYLTNTSKDTERAKLVLEYLLSPEGTLDMAAGEEGVTFTVENGEIHWLAEGAEQYYNSGLIASIPIDVELPAPDPVLENNMERARGFRLVEDLAPYVSASEAVARRGADIKKVMEEYFSKIIIGDLELDQYDKFVEEVSGDLDAILEEVNAIYVTMN